MTTTASITALEEHDAHTEQGQIAIITPLTGGRHARPYPQLVEGPHSPLAELRDPGLAHALEASALARLGLAAIHHPELKRAEEDARLKLAVAVIAMDNAAMSGTAIDVFGPVIEDATQQYAQALANLLRGESPLC